MNELAALQTIPLLLVSFVLCLAWQKNKSRSLGNLFISIAVIAMACIYGQFMIDFSELIDLTASKGFTSKVEAAEAKAAVAIWAGIASLVVGGVGVNLLSSWFDS